MTKCIYSLWAAAVLSGMLSAAETRVWEQAAYADFEKGDRRKLSLRSDGRLMLAPVFREIVDSSLPYLWAIVEDSKGNVYAGGGGPGGPGARIYVASREGKTRLFSELEGLEVHALAVDNRDRVYAATSPDGKVYRIEPDGTPRLFFDPHAKYIWAMAFDSKGNLLLATGDGGLIYGVAPDGTGSVFFRTEETHVRSLAIDARDNLIAGTEPGGLIVRITPAGEGLVLYQAAKREITAVAVDGDGGIWAAGVGNKQAVPAPPVPPAPKPVESVPVGTPQQTAPAQPGQRPPAPPPTLALPLAVVGGSEVYRIDADGFPRKVWSHGEEIVYAIALDAQGRPLLGTGNKGFIYRIDSDLLYTVLVSAPPAQVSALLPAGQGRIYVATGNVGKVYQLGPGIETEGTFESDVLDAGLFSTWGALAVRWKPNGGRIRFETRSGNRERPVKDWSSWAEVPLESDSGRIQSPPARFLQWRMTLSALDGQSPLVESVQAAYLTRNVPPVVEVVEITPPNYKFPPQSLSLTPSQNLTLPPLGRGKRQPPSSVQASTAVSMQYEKGHLGARWEAADANSDTLLYKVEIRGVGESVWKLLKDRIKEKQLSWDSTAFPDGHYELRVTATDAPSNPPAQALQASLVSEPFLIDNTPPQISGLAAAATSASELMVTWKAADAGSVIRQAEYAVNGGEWTVVLPTTAVSDSRSHDYHLKLQRQPSEELTVAVRVTDEFDNHSVVKVVAR